MMTQRIWQGLALGMLGMAVTACSYTPQGSHRYGTHGHWSDLQQYDAVRYGGGVACGVELQPCGYIEQYVAVQQVRPMVQYQVETTCCAEPSAPPPVVELPPPPPPPVVELPPEPPVYVPPAPEPPVYIPPPPPPMEPPVYVPPMTYPEPELPLPPPLRK